jgi:hypothetical protein
MDLCEHLPLQAKLADKFALVRSATWTEVEHQRMEIFTGFPTKEHRPAFGSLVSRMARGRDELLPKFVSLSGRHRAVAEAEQPLYAGAQHRPFVPTDEGLKSMEVNRQVDLSRLRSRKELLSALDTLRRDVDARGEMGALDAFTGQALDMVTGGRARKAFDLSDENPRTLDRYRAGGDRFKCNGGMEFWDWEAFVRARRLVEAGVPFVSMEVGSWDNHGTIFNDLRAQLPLYDMCLSALITDLCERGLDKEVCVVVWGEFGRSPRVEGGGRGHHPGAGSVLFSGGGLRMGQVVGATDARGERPITRPYSPQNILATLYHVLGIDPSVTITDPGGRPQYLLDDREPVAELI